MKFLTMNKTKREVILLSSPPKKWDSIVTVECPNCRDRRDTPYWYIKKAGHSLCKGCARTLDLTGKKFGRLRVLKYAGRGNGKGHGSRWLCECECGELRIIPTGSLTSSNTMSCGCKNRDETSLRRGNKSPLWGGGKITLSCEVCGKKYKRKPAAARSSKFCSKTCKGVWMSENLSGENSHNWNPSLTMEERIIGRSYADYKRYVTAVFERDNYTCSVCGRHGGEFQVHHLYSYKHYPEYALDVDYGVTVCIGEHRDFHKWNGGPKKKCTPSDFYRWKDEYTKCRL